MINCPIYKDAPVPNKRPETANGGLWYNKFCNTWKDDFSGLIEPPKQNNQQEEGGKKKWIDGMTKSSVGDKALLWEAKKRRRDLVKAFNGKTVTLKSNSVLVCGLGQSHPVENGFLWHHTLGVPYIPGSSIKGIVRSWAAWRGKPDINRIFGPRDNEDTHGVGAVIFMDALPAGTVRLKTEIMTPHYDSWYQNGEIPGDWHDPIPIPFLAVEPGQEFTFAVMPSNKNNIEECDKVLEWLVSTLVDFGAGAKTAIGFGRFDPPESVPVNDIEETWEGVMLSYNPGNGIVSARGADGRMAEALNTRERPLIGNEIITRIKKKKKIVKARVTVSPAGGKSFKLLKVDVI